MRLPASAASFPRRSQREHPQPGKGGDVDVDATARKDEQRCVPYHQARRKSKRSTGDAEWWHENDPQHQVGDQTGTDPAYGCTLVASHDQYVARRARGSIEELRESQYPDRSCPNVKARTERVEIDTGKDRERCRCATGTDTMNAACATRLVAC